MAFALAGILAGIFAAATLSFALVVASTVMCGNAGAGTGPGTLVLVRLATVEPAANVRLLQQQAHIFISCGTVSAFSGRGLCCASCRGAGVWRVRF